MVLTQFSLSFHLNLPWPPFRNRPSHPLPLAIVSGNFFLETWLPPPPWWPGFWLQVFLWPQLNPLHFCQHHFWDLRSPRMGASNSTAFYQPVQSWNHLPRNQFLEREGWSDKWGIVLYFLLGSERLRQPVFAATWWGGYLCFFAAHAGSFPLSWVHCLPRRGHLTGFSQPSGLVFGC